MLVTETPRRPVSSPRKCKSFRLSTPHDFSIIRERYFSERPGDMPLFESLIFTVPKTVGRVKKIGQLSKHDDSKLLNHLYHLGIKELLLICSEPVIENSQALESYVEERLASTLLAELGTV